MSNSYQNYIETQSNYKLTNLKNINYDRIIDLFGDYLSFN